MGALVVPRAAHSISTNAARLPHGEGLELRLSRTSVSDPQFGGNDEDADVMYIGFCKPQRATESQARESRIITPIQGREIVGLTILEASVRSGR